MCVLPPTPLPSRRLLRLQIFLTFFKTLEGKTITVELKNDLQIRGTLASVDQYLNFKMSGVSAVDKDRFPQLVSLSMLLNWPLIHAALSNRVNTVLTHRLFALQLSVTDLFVRGSVIRYVLVPPEEVDTGLLQDAARREAMESAKLAGAGAGGSRR